MLNRVVVGLFLCLASPATLAAQAVFGNIVGTVTDPGAAAVPNAKVAIKDLGTGVLRTVTTNSDGNYSQTHLVVGKYEVRVEASGFDTSINGNATVAADETT